MKAPLTKPNTESGLASIVIVAIIIALLSLLMVGFTREMDREYRQATDRQLASEANYAAESGMNDARAYLEQKLKGGADPGTLDTGGQCLENTNPSGLPTPFVNNGSVSGYYADPTNTSANNLIKYSCVIINTQPKEIIKSPLKKNQSIVYKIVPASGDSLNNLFLSWKNYNETSANALSGDASNPSLPKETTASSGDKLGILRATLYPAINGSGSTSTDQAVAAASRTYFLYPNSSASSGVPGQVPYDNSAKQGYVNGNCNTQNADPTHTPLPFTQGHLYYCNTQIYNLPSPISAPTASLTTQRTDIYSGNYTTISWNATPAASTTCVGSNGDNGWSGNKASSGSYTTGSLSSNTTFSLKCSGPGGSTRLLSVTVTVHPNPPGPKTYTVTATSDNAIDNFYINGHLVDFGSSPDWSDWWVPKTGTVTLPSAPQEYAIKAENWPNGMGWSSNPAMVIFSVTDPSGAVVASSNGTVGFSGWTQPQGASDPVGWPDPSSSTLSGWGSIDYQNFNGPTTWGYSWQSQFSGWPDSSAQFMWPASGVGDANMSNYIAYFFAGTDPSPPSIPTGGTTDSYTPPAPTGPVPYFYYIRLTALYQDLDVSVQGADAGSNAIPLEDAQAVIDVTGEGNNQLKRVHSVISLSNNYSLPEDTLQSMASICKRQRLPVGPSGSSDYLSSVIDDLPSTNGTVGDGAECQPQ